MIFATQSRTHSSPAQVPIERCTFFFIGVRTTIVMCPFSCLFPNHRRAVVQCKGTVEAEALHSSFSTAFRRPPTIAKFTSGELGNSLAIAILGIATPFTN